MSVDFIDYFRFYRYFSAIHRGFYFLPFLLVSGRFAA